jgi:hypothetical protein
MLCSLRAKCPELLDEMCVQSFLFAPGAAADEANDTDAGGENSCENVSSVFNDILGPSSATDANPACSGSKHTSMNNPNSMAAKFGVNYLGELILLCGFLDFILLLQVCNLLMAFTVCIPITVLFYYCNVCTYTVLS